MARIMISASKGKYNYAHFVIELTGRPLDIGDGYAVLAHVYDADDPEEEVTSQARRMIFVKNTPPANEMLKLSRHDRLQVLGIPRVNLAEVYEIAQSNGYEQVM